MRFAKSSSETPLRRCVVTVGKMKGLAITFSCSCVVSLVLADLMWDRFVPLLAPYRWLVLRLSVPLLRVLASLLLLGHHVSVPSSSPRFLLRHHHQSHGEAFLQIQKHLAPRRSRKR
jgi:hypothetical protein